MYKNRRYFECVKFDDGQNKWCASNLTSSGHVSDIALCSDEAIEECLPNFYKNGDLAGYDIDLHRRATFVKTYSDCQLACQKDQRCKSWVFGILRNARCFFKSVDESTKAVSQLPLQFQWGNKINRN